MLAFLRIVGVFSFVVCVSVAFAQTRPLVIGIPADASDVQVFAARELRRYLWLTTNATPPIVAGPFTSLPGGADCIVLGRSGDAAFREFAAGHGIADPGEGLSADGFRVRTVASSGRHVCLITGADDPAILRAAYRFLERFGIRWSPAEDILPDRQVEFVLSEGELLANPVFAVRGLFPYHSMNAEGPEMWNADTYRLFLGQMAKMGFNFIGLHVALETYCAKSYGMPPGPMDWNLNNVPTNPAFGAHLAFTSDLWTSDGWRSARNLPTEGARRAAMKASNSALFADVFGFARRLGIRSAAGHEVLTYPGARSTYEGIFRDFDAGMRPDYHWLSTPEWFLYRDPDAAYLDLLVQSYADALAARNATGSQQRLATMGWMMGPRQDLTFLHRNLAAEWTMSSMNPWVGKGEVHPEWAQVGGRPRWAIPWMEDDFNLLCPQLWVARTARDGRDARRFGMEGLIGTHWRVRILTPQMQALARLGWEGDLDTTAFWRDFARTQFGPEVAPEAAAILAAVDGNLPEVSAWTDGWPGGVTYDAGYWADNAARFTFVAQLESLESRVRGPRNLERFRFYLNQFRFLRALARFRSSMRSPAGQADLEEAYRALIASAVSHGELGNVLTLARQYGAGYSRTYAGEPRLIVLNPRTSLEPTESLRLSVAFLTSAEPARLFLRWRPLGGSAWTDVEAARGAKNGFEVVLTPAQIGGADVEYILEATDSSGARVVWPASAPERGQTVVQFARAVPPDLPLPAPRPLRRAGAFTEPFDLEFAPAGPGTRIRYTLDGSAPSASHGSILGGPVRLSQTTTVRAVTVGQDGAVSPETSATYTLVRPQVLDRVNAAGGAVGAFASDRGFGPSRTAFHTGTIEAGIPGAAPAAVYQSERWSEGPLTFTSELLPGEGTYLVRLHFAENWASTIGQRVFGVSVQGAMSGPLYLPRVDVLKLAGGRRGRPVVLEFPGVRPDEQGRIVVELQRGTANNPFLNAVEILPDVSETVLMAVDFRDAPLDGWGGASGGAGPGLDLVANTGEVVELFVRTIGPGAYYYAFNRGTKARFLRLSPTLALGDLWLEATVPPSPVRSFRFVLENTYSPLTSRLRSPPVPLSETGETLVALPLAVFEGTRGPEVFLQELRMPVPGESWRNGLTFAFEEFGAAGRIRFDGFRIVVRRGATPYARWQWEQFSAEDLATGTADVRADPTGSGIINLLRYAFGIPAVGQPRMMDGTTPGLPKVVVHSDVSGPRLVVEFLRRRYGAAPGLLYRPLFGNTPSVRDASVAGEIVTVEQIDGVWERVLARDPEPIGPAGRFATVEVSGAP